MMKKVYLASLYRFGYDLTTVETSEEKAVNAIMTEYVRAYKDINGTDPTEDISNDYYDNSETYYEVAKQEIDITEMVIGKVEWL